MNDYDRIAKVIRFIDQHQAEQPSLAVIADHVGLSTHHFHRLFSKWAGVSPKSFLQCLTVAHAKEALNRGATVLDTAFDVGLSGPGRLHDLCVSIEAASPGEIKTGGAGWKICCGFSETPFGICLVANSPRGVCHVSFVNDKNPQVAAELIRQQWHSAELTWSDKTAREVCDRVFVRADFDDESTRHPIRLRTLVVGSSFQIKVWRALLEIPFGEVATYGGIAAAIGQPNAARAVGTAIGRNSLAYLIPCHRVIRETGVIGEYRWKQTRKRALLAWESAIAQREIASDRVD